MIRTLEELSINAQPALRSMYYDGWIIRFADGYSRRANSVNPIYASTLDIDEKIRFCELTYRSEGQKVIFKLTDAVFPEDLDAELKGRGYGLDIPVSIQTIDLGQVGEGGGGWIMVEEEPTDEWQRWFIKTGDVESRHLATVKAMLKRIAPERAFFSIMRDGQIAACGLAVLQDSYLGLFDIMVDPKYRRQGLGERMSLNMLRWGRANGAKTAYLQVMMNNEPALKLYEKIGFSEVYKYWYRVRE